MGYGLFTPMKVFGRHGLQALRNGQIVKCVEDNQTLLMHVTRIDSFGEVAFISPGNLPASGEAKSYLNVRGEGGRITCWKGLPIKFDAPGYKTTYDYFTMLNGGQIAA